MSNENMGESRRARERRSEDGSTGVNFREILSDSSFNNKNPEKRDLMQGSEESLPYHGSEAGGRNFYGGRKCSDHEVISWEDASRGGLNKRPDEFKGKYANKREVER